MLGRVLVLGGSVKSFLVVFSRFGSQGGMVRKILLN